MAAQSAARLARNLAPVGKRPHKDGSPHLRDTIGVQTLDGAVALVCEAPYAEFVNAKNPFFSKAVDFMSLEMLIAMQGLV
jgi:hypothetical protein